MDGKKTYTYIRAREVREKGGGAGQTRIIMLQYWCWCFAKTCG